MSADLVLTLQARIANEQARMVQAKAEIAQLQASHDRAEAEVRRLLEFAQTYFELTGVQVPEITEQGMNVPASPPTRRAKNPSRDIVVENVLDILSRSDRPMSRRELFDSLSERSIVLQGKDPEMILSTMLWRSKDKIVRLPEYGYWPSARDFAPAKYDSFFGALEGAVANEPEGGVEVDDAD